MSGTAADPYRIHLNAEGREAVPGPLLANAVDATLRDGAVPEAEVSVTFLDDAAMARLNERYLDRAGTTDVIAFSLADEDEPPLGDVYVGVEQARRQAAELGVPLEEELVRLVIHGTLHVLGHDHPAGPERTGSPMFQRQEALVRSVLDGSAPPASGQTTP